MVRLVDDKDEDDGDDDDDKEISNHSPASFGYFSLSFSQIESVLIRTSFNFIHIP